MTETTTVIKIPLFDGTNFSNWKYRVGILLAANRDKVKKDEKKCISILVHTMHDSQLEYVKDKTFAKEMFDGHQWCISLLIRLMFYKNSGNLWQWMMKVYTLRMWLENFVKLRAFRLFLRC